MAGDAPTDRPPKLELSGRRPAPTIRDVARLAEVSIGTVSKALNEHGRLRVETRQKILRVARELGYRPNDMAQSLHRAKSMTVGILSTDSFGRFTFPIFQALEERLADQGIAVFMCNATDDPARERQHVEQLLGKRVDGIVVTARRSDRRPPVDVGVAGLPLIYVFSQTDDPDAFCLLPDDEGGARQATEHLLKLGRRRIAHISGPERFEAVRLRRLGYARALDAAGCSAIEDYFIATHWSERAGYEAALRLLDGPLPHPDAIFCGNDQLARGALDALRERGISVPADIAIVGFDNWDVMVEATRPRLTSVDMNLRALGHQAGDKLLAMIAGQHLVGTHRLPATLAVRESCGA
jgi:LacI family transcriptional regulator